MKLLNLNVSFDHVIPQLAREFRGSNWREKVILGERVEKTERETEDEDEEPPDVDERIFKNELCSQSWTRISFTDERVLRRASTGDPGLLCALAMRIGRSIDAVDVEEERQDMTEDVILLLREACHGGDRRAQFVLGERFVRMKGGLEEGVLLLGQSASNGFRLAQERLIELYERRYVFGDEASEHKWLLKFARAGVVEAQFDLASSRYLGGELQEAFLWMEKAAKGGHIRARERLALFYELGEGCERSKEKAAFWRRGNLKEIPFAPAQTEDDEEFLEVVVEESPSVEPHHAKEAHESREEAKRESTFGGIFQRISAWLFGDKTR